MRDNQRYVLEFRSVFVDLVIVDKITQDTMFIACNLSRTH